MFTYTHPSQDVEFLLKDVLEYDRLCREFKLADIDSNFMLEILGEAARFGREELDPLYQSGDRDGVKRTTDSKGEQTVVQAPGYAEAYARFSEAGWTSLSGPSEFGGQALPYTLAVAVSEIFQSCNLAFALCPMLSNGAIEALVAHGSDDLKEKWLPGLIAGRFTGTMNLTEPQAGSDLAAIRTTARPENNHYRIRGQKIFISWGDHQMAENIVHLVLARLEGAPEGIRGLSLFLVPKFINDDSGNSIPNDVTCISVEHKMGLHASPTCTMQFGQHGGAIGYLVGEENAGLSCMFTMMNNARQAVGIQGLAGAERASQMAAQYAVERVQGTRPDGERFAIANFPDVKRMLQTMQALCETMRGVAYYGAACLDRAHYLKDDAVLKRSELFTPIIKGWITELAQEVCATAQQVHGGMGYIEETGVAQIYRDVRVFAIYEGTTAIQANDLVQRKILRDGGQTIFALLDDMLETATDLELVRQLEWQGKRLRAEVESTRTITKLMIDQSRDDMDAVMGCGFTYLMALGYLCGAWMAAQFSLNARKNILISENKDISEGKLQVSHFYFRQILPRGIGLLLTVESELKYKANEVC